MIDHFLSRRCASLERRSTSALLLSTSELAVASEMDVASLRCHTASRSRSRTCCARDEERRQVRALPGPEQGKTERTDCLPPHS